MLRYHGLLLSLIKTYKSLLIVPGIPIRWNERQGKFFIRLENKVKIWLVALVLIATLNAGSVRLYSKQKDVVKCSVGIIGLNGLAYGACFLYIFTSTDAINRCLTFFNGLLQIETEFNKTGKHLNVLDLNFKDFSTNYLVTNF